MHLSPDEWPAAALWRKRRRNARCCYAELREGSAEECEGAFLGCVEFAKPGSLRLQAGSQQVFP